MNATEHDRGAAAACQRADLVATQGVARVNADADDITLLDRVGIERAEGLVGDQRIAVELGCRRGENI